MPSCALSRRDPPNGKNGFSKTKGFTVIELMIAVAVLAIITSLALPSYRALLEKRQVTSAAQQLAAFLSSAQLESVKRNQFVAVNLEFNGGEWCLGMTDADRPQDATCDCTIDAPENEAACILDNTGEAEMRVLRFSSLAYPEVLSETSAVGDGNIVFDPVRGLILDAETASIDLISPDQEMYALTIGLTPTGRVKICSDSVRGDKLVPGYEECQP